MWALVATVLASLILTACPASAATLEPPPMGAAGAQLEAALNDVVAAGVPGIIVLVQDGNRAARHYARRGERPRHRYRASAHRRALAAGLTDVLLYAGGPA